MFQEALIPEGWGMRVGVEKEWVEEDVSWAWGRHPLEPFASLYWTWGLLWSWGPADDFFESWEEETLALCTAFYGSFSGHEGWGAEKFSWAFDFRMINLGDVVTKTREFWNCFLRYRIKEMDSRIKIYSWGPGCFFLPSFSWDQVSKVLYPALFP